MSKEINDANFIRLAADCVGEGLIVTGQRNYELAKQMAKQQSIEFLKWYAIKMIEFLGDIKGIRPNIISIEIESALMKFEGKTFDELYELYLQHKSKQP